MRIKWENVLFIAYTIFAFIQVIGHAKSQTPLFFTLEVLIQFMFACGLHYIVKDLRTNPPFEIIFTTEDDEKDL